MNCGCLQGHYIGSDLKFAIDIKAEGFDMASDEFKLELRCGSVSHEVSEEELAHDSEGQCYLLVDTTEFPTGILKMIVTAYVPDEDFPNGVRREVGQVDLCRINHH